MFNSISHSFAALTSEIYISSSTQEEENSRACNILYINYVSIWNISMTSITNMMVNIWNIAAIYHYSLIYNEVSATRYRVTIRSKLAITELIVSQPDHD